MQFRVDSDIKRSSINFVRLLPHIFTKGKIIINSGLKLLLYIRHILTLKIYKVTDAFDFPKQKLVFRTILHFRIITLVL